MNRLFEGNNLMLIVLVVVLLMMNGNGEGNVMSNTKPVTIPKEFLLIGVVVLGYFLLQQNNSENFGMEETVTDNQKIDTNYCSPQCCGNTYWPTSVPPLPADPKLKGK